MPSLDTIEAATNATVGLLVSWIATYTVLPLWGLHPSASVSAGLTGLFFALSFSRSWVVRKIFRRISGNA